MSERLRSIRAARFTPALRLRHKIEFDRAYREGKRSSNEYFSAVATGNLLSHARLGLAISVKAAGKAVDRNRIKRLIRESFRRNYVRLPALDVVVSARSSARLIENAHLFRSLEQLWDKLARHA